MQTQLESPQVKRRTRRFCWTCYGYTLEPLHEVCLLPEFWDESIGRLRPAVHRQVCKWCYIQIVSRNMQFGSNEELRRYWQCFELGRGLYRQRPQNQRQDPNRPKITKLSLLEPCCYFCGGHIGEADRFRRPSDIHHKIPRREFVDPITANQLSNLSFAHRPCHQWFNWLCDPEHLQHIPFAERWGDQDLGKNIFQGYLILDF